MSDRLRTLASEVAGELTEHILPYWIDKTVDWKYGGFSGRITGEGRVVPDAPKGAVLNARILWTFAAAFGRFGDAAFRKLADRAYKTIIDRFIDRQSGGVFWMLSANGQPLEEKKQVYAHAFALYALSEYARVTEHQSAVRQAIGLFRLLEEKARDRGHGGYVDAFAADWSPTGEMRLSKKDLNAAKTMNTHLHMMEAYTGLYRIWRNNAVRERLIDLVRLHLDRILDRQSMHLSLYFDMEWRSLSGTISYGHDIEASWLLVESAEELGDEDLLAEVRSTAVRMVDRTIREGIEPGGAVWNERTGDGVIDANRHWWPQVEAIVGLVNAYQLTSESRYLDLAVRCWEYCRKYLVDRKLGEWHWGVTPSGEPMPERDKIGPWKGPYHHSRMCLEIMRRSESLDDLAG